MVMRHDPIDPGQCGGRERPAQLEPFGAHARLRVVLATDGSRHAQAAAGWLAGLPLPSDTAVLVVAVADPPRPPFTMPRVRAYDDVVQAAARRAAGDAADVVSRRWATETCVAEGDPRVVVPERAESWHADLVVAGARGLGAVSGLVLGSVSRAIVHAAHCAVLVVKGEPRPVRHVVVAIDGSGDARAAAGFVAALPLAPSTVVRFVGVVDQPSYPLPVAERTARVAGELDAVTRARRYALGEAIARAEAGFRDRELAVEETMAVGRPADEIVAVAAATDADLIVTGARGFGPVKRLLLGSVSERVLYLADTPVLVVKTGARALSASAAS